MAVHKLFYIEDLSPLYEDVQTAKLFPDSKFFVDCIPNSSAEHILAAYRLQKTLPGFDLRGFVATWFRFPEASTAGYSSEGKTPASHAHALWDFLTREPDTDTATGTLIPLPYPYIVPGGRFREIYYWDSYFTMLGLQVDHKTQLIQHMVDNFAWLIDELGFIPNGNRTYYLGRSQPPFFSLMVTILAQEKGRDVLATYRTQLEKEYAFWMDGAEGLSQEHPAHRRVVRLEDGSILNRHWDDNDTPRPEAFSEDLHIASLSGRDPATVYRHIRAGAESGWDYTCRWFKDGSNLHTVETTDIIPVDLNCLLLFLEIALCTIYELNDPHAMEAMLKKVMLRNRAIEKYCWSGDKGFYFDYHFHDRHHTGVYSLAGVYPLFFNIASPEQVKKVASVVTEQFLQPGGLLSTLTETGQQWDAPNGWAPLQWIAYKGFQKNGETALADMIRDRWMHTNEAVFNASGKMMEKYNVTNQDTNAGGGEYPNQDGFGWTNGVYLKMKSEKTQG
ncbi:alpha,alpha-trehalase TreF [Sediminibacterium soli]|uniref:alpha,alpha-trehalase TreF n=1 Tax=Sediminibacterium soli TaxID=2698829 RepID=UPI00137AD457|nr:alpha,alpha-trehalase TreF [Sediminibacterium soli]NCI46978.1 alpha,alpha-trehalase TreF [Sediminibacterium soli]